MSQEMNSAAMESICRALCKSRAHSVCDFDTHFKSPYFAVYEPQKSNDPQLQRVSSRSRNLSEGIYLQKSSIFKTNPIAMGTQHLFASCAHTLPVPGSASPWTVKFGTAFASLQPICRDTDRSIPPFLLNHGTCSASRTHRFVTRR